jgi:hypothetical protein
VLLEEGDMALNDRNRGRAQVSDQGAPDAEAVVLVQGRPWSVVELVSGRGGDP